MTYKWAKCILWTGIIFYLTSMTTLQCLIFVTFPGYVNENKSDEFWNWYDGYYFTIFLIQNAIWLAINLISTSITIYAIRVVYAVVSRLTN